MTTAAATTASETGTSRLAFALAGVSGFVDGVGASFFVGLFVSFMSGDTTSTGIAIAQGAWLKAAYGLTTVAFYVVGIVLGSLLLTRSPRLRSPLLAVTAVLLALFAVFIALVPKPVGWFELIGLGLLVLAMGIMNTTLRHVGGSTVGLGYVTGTLVSFGEGVAAVIAAPRGERHGAAVALFGGLWLAFLLGAILGGLGVRLFGAWSVLLPIVILVLALTRPSTRTPPQPADL